MLQPGLKCVHGSLAIQDSTRYTGKQEEGCGEASGGASVARYLGCQRGIKRLEARQALLEHAVSQYQSASASEKKQILTQFVTSTGYVRKYAAWVLNHAEEILQVADAPRSRYGPEVQRALVLVWETLNQICVKRLVPFLPDIIAFLSIPPDSLEEVLMQEPPLLASLLAERNAGNH